MLSCLKIELKNDIKVSLAVEREGQLKREMNKDSEHVWER